MRLPSVPPDAIAAMVADGVRAGGEPAKEQREHEATVRPLAVDRLAGRLREPDPGRERVLVDGAVRSQEVVEGHRTRTLAETDDLDFLTFETADFS